MVDEQRAGADVRHALTAAIRKHLAGEGFRKGSYVEMETGHVRIDIYHPTSFSRTNWRVVRVRVEPIGIRGARAVSYEIEVEKATPALIAEKARKAAGRAKDYNERGREDERRWARERSQREREDAMITEAARSHFPDFAEAEWDSRKFEKEGVTLQGAVRDGAVLFELRVTQPLTPEQAREVVDALEKQTA